MTSYIDMSENGLMFSECNKIISEVPFTQLEASSQKNGKNRHTCDAANGHIHSSGGWAPKRSNGLLINEHL